MRRLLLLWLVPVMTACGARTDLPEPPEEDTDATFPDGEPPMDAVPPPIDVVVVDVPPPPDDVIVIDAPPPPPPPPPPPMCTTDCTSNHECESTCPTLPMGRWCCDEPTGMCYAHNGKHCPFSIPDAGFD